MNNLISKIENEIEKINKLPAFTHGRPYFHKTIEHVKNGGLWLEFGVCSGWSINIISERADGIVFGFDCFTGLPEDWGNHQKKGTYDRGGNLPKVNDNVELVVGLFQDTLEDFLKEYPYPAAYIHIDCDLYSSTKYVLEQLVDRIVPGTVISFDEIKDGDRYYPEYIDHEIKAWIEFCEENNVKYEWITRTTHEQASCIIK